jgi:hypothetical protein
VARRPMDRRLRTTDGVCADRWAPWRSTASARERPRGAGGAQVAEVGGLG